MEKFRIRGELFYYYHSFSGSPAYRYWVETEEDGEAHLNTLPAAVSLLEYIRLEFGNVNETFKHWMTKISEQKELEGRLKTYYNLYVGK